MKKDLLKSRLIKSTATIALALSLATSLQGCIFALAGAAGGGLAMVATDRRTLGAQTEDKEIQVKVKSRFSKQLSKDSIVSVTSFNRRVLLTGQVSSEEQKNKAEEIVRTLNNVSGIANEIQVTSGATESTSTSDAYLLTKVKGALLSTKDISSAIYKVVCDHGVIYLMGIVTPQEGKNAALVASTVKGVKGVVKVFQYIEPSSTQNSNTQPTPSSSSTEQQAPAPIAESPAR